MAKKTKASGKARTRLKDPSEPFVEIGEPMRARIQAAVTHFYKGDARKDFCEKLGIDPKALNVGLSSGSMGGQKWLAVIEQMRIDHGSEALGHLLNTPSGDKRLLELLKLLYSSIKAVGLDKVYYQLLLLNCSKSIDKMTSVKIKTAKK